MKRIALLTIVLMVALTACHNKKKEQLLGIWKLEYMDLNGTVIRGEQLGKWLYEFNDTEGYMVDVAGVKEKGKYKLDDKTLTLTSFTFKDKPATVFNIALFDSVNLELYTKTKDNTTRIKLLKIEGSIDEEKEEERERKEEMKKENS
jgi:hypothetical protein